MSSIIELILVLAMLGVQDPVNPKWKERDLSILVTSAQANRPNQLVIESSFRNALFSHHSRYAKKTNTGKELPNGWLSLDTDVESTSFKTPFTLQKNGTYDLTLPSEDFMEKLKNLSAKLSSTIQFVDASGKALKSLKLTSLGKKASDEKQKAPTKQATAKEGFHHKFFAMPKPPTPEKQAQQSPKQTMTPLEKLVSQSVMVELGDREIIAKRLENFRAAKKYVAPNNEDETPASWKIGQKAYQDHFNSASVQVSFSKSIPGKRTRFSVVDEYLITAHPTDKQGQMLLPVLDEPKEEAENGGEQIAVEEDEEAKQLKQKRQPIFLSEVVRKDGTITKIKIDFDDFVKTVMVANKKLDPNKPYQCLLGDDIADSACKKDSKTGKFYIELQFPTEKKTGDTKQEPKAEEEMELNTFTIELPDEITKWEVEIVPNKVFFFEDFAPISERKKKGED